jgi:peroxiredoxin
MTTLLQPGTAAPEFELTAPDGRTVRLSDYRGRVLVLAFLRGFL